VTWAAVGVVVGLALLAWLAALTRRDVRMLAAQVAIVTMRMAEVAEVVDTLNKDLRKMAEEETP
jgi:hypothetical protein